VFTLVKHIIFLLQNRLQNWLQRTSLLQEHHLLLPLKEFRFLVSEDLMDKMGVLETLTTALTCVAAGNAGSEEKSLKEGFVVLQ
jgi:hypothetical protein